MSRLLRKLVTKLRNEPVMIQSALQLLGSGIAKYAFQVSAQQLIEINAVTVPLLGLAVRSVVTPVKKGG